MEIVRDEDEEMGRHQVNEQDFAISDQDQPEDVVTTALKLISTDDKIKIDI